MYLVTTTIFSTHNPMWNNFSMKNKQTDKTQWTLNHGMKGRRWKTYYLPYVAFSCQIDIMNLPYFESGTVHYQSQGNQEDCMDM